MSRKSAPSTVAAALRILANDITSPDDVPVLCLREAADMIEAQAVEIERLREALTPSADTKSAYKGELKFKVSAFDSMGYYQDYECVVPWDTIKDTMKMIRERASLRYEDKTSDNARKSGMEE